MKAKRSILNLIFGIGSQLITILLGIIIPRLFLVHFGSEVNGLLSSIGQIVIYLSLLEAGVGAASLQALYKQVTKGDKRSINEILSATSLYYKKTGIYYFISVILISIIYPIIVHSNINKITIATVILLTGLGGAFNYYFQGTYKIFLIAEGKSYIVTIITTIINILINIAKIILIIKGFNIIIIQTSYFILTIIQILFYKIYIARKYTWIKLNEKPNLQAISQKKSVLIHQLSFLIFNNTDVLILTIYTNLKIVSVYVLYNMLFTVLDNFINTINSSITFALGQTYHEDSKKFLRFQDAYEVYFMAFVFALFTVAYILILPFMRLYTAGINDVNYIDFWIPILFVFLKLLVNARVSSNNLINIAGHFRKTQYRSILESSINIVLSIIFVNFIGIYGVLIGTICALLYRSIDMIIYSNLKILNRKPIITIKRWIINLIIFITVNIIFHNINIRLTSYFEIITTAILLTIVILPLYLILCSLFERDIFVFSKNLLINYIKNYKKEKQVAN
ncbi:sugar isomerase [Terrilactibacillus laevilacticus]|uniref:Sugar isomerase n=1 Tax=Terrilactibacillus laevilacticus TaxID=1380157 RepID=A0ABW5PNB1_9BACI|nr:sugar isomerase [Terrilactibacillus laevilacticus]